MIPSRLLVELFGWLQRKEREVISFLREENRVLQATAARLTGLLLCDECYLGHTTMSSHAQPRIFEVHQGLWRRRPTHVEGATTPPPVGPPPIATGHRRRTSFESTGSWVDTHSIDNLGVAEVFFASLADSEAAFRSF